MKIYERNEFWVIVGVIVGFLLSVFWEIGKNIYSLCKKRSAIESELRTNLGLLPQIIDILEQARDSFIHESVLPTHSVHFKTYAYNLYIGDVAPDLSAIQRENLHIINEKFRVVDNFLDNFFKEFLELRASGQLDDPFDAYKGMCEDLIANSNLLKELIDEYLAGNPRKVTWD